MNSDLRLDWCSYEAAKYAVEHWHYSRTMPVGKMAKVGVWEYGEFVGAVLWGLGGGGACDGRSYGLARNFEMSELQRMALREHHSPVSRIIAVSVRMIRSYCPGLRLLISYADPVQQHHGGIYQAAGWTYTGMSAADWKAVWANGKEAHSRIAREHVQFGIKKTVDISDAVRVAVPGKHRYLYPLDAEMRARIAPLAKPYPKRAGSIVADAPAIHAGEGGAEPTPALHLPW